LAGADASAGAGDAAAAGVATALDVVDWAMAGADMNAVRQTLAAMISMFFMSLLNLPPALAALTPLALQRNIRYSFPAYTPAEQVGRQAERCAGIPGID
jgi:hypothetical protein